MGVIVIDNGVVQRNNVRRRSLSHFAFSVELDHDNLVAETSTLEHWWRRLAITGNTSTVIAVYRLAVAQRRLLENRMSCNLVRQRSVSVLTFWNMPVINIAGNN